MFQNLPLEILVIISAILNDAGILYNLALCSKALAVYSIHNRSAMMKYFTNRLYTSNRFDELLKLGDLIDEFDETFLMPLISTKCITSVRYCCCSTDNIQCQCQHTLSIVSPLVHASQAGNLDLLKKILSYNFSDLDYKAAYDKVHWHIYHAARTLLKPYVPYYPNEFYYWANPDYTPAIIVMPFHCIFVDTPMANTDLVIMSVEEDNIDSDEPAHTLQYPSCFTK